MRNIPPEEIIRQKEHRGVIARDILDFRTPVNPLGPSPKVKAELRKHLKYLDRYPDPDCVRLRLRIAQREGIDPGSIICTNGFAPALGSLAAALGPDGVILPSPASPNHLAAAEIPGLLVHQLSSWTPGELPDTLPDRALLLLGNPDFPHGNVWTPGALAELARRAGRTGGVVLVDESFAEFCPDSSVLSAMADADNILVYRSFSPFHGIAGLRIGFLVASPGLADRIRNTGEAHAVNALAQRAAFVALGDSAFARGTLEWCREERAYLIKELSKAGCTVGASPANYLVLRHDAAAQLHEHLRRRKILLGFDSSETGYGPDAAVVCLRIHKHNARLAREVRHFLKRNSAA